MTDDVVGDVDGVEGLEGVPFGDVVGEVVLVEDADVGFAVLEELLVLEGHLFVTVPDVGDGVVLGALEGEFLGLEGDVILS